MLGKIIGWLSSLFNGKKEKSIGIFGPVNVGKTTLANRICEDLCGEKLGAVSDIPHETRQVAKREKLTLQVNGSKLKLNLLDTPGIAEKVDYRDFLAYGVLGDEAIERAREATKGVIEALDAFSKVDAALLMVDATVHPYSHINVSILRNLEEKNVPVILVANKIDLKSAKVEEIAKAFPEYPLIEISALTGKNIQSLYEKMAKNFS